MRRCLTLFAFLSIVSLISLSVSAQQITTYIGGGPNDIPALDAGLWQPYGVAVDSSGNVYFSAYAQHRVFKVDTKGIITVVAGSGAQGYRGNGTVGGAGNADLNHPFGVAVDNSGNVYIADYDNCAVRKVDTTQTITTLYGHVGQCNSSDGDLDLPTGVVADNKGNLFIDDTNNCVIRKLVLSTGVVNTVAGMVRSCGYSGDGSAADSAELYYPQAIAIDAAGDLFISDTGNCVIREVSAATGTINTIAGDHTCGFAGDGGAATSAEIHDVLGITVDSSGTNVTISDTNNNRIRQFAVGGNITTVAGDGDTCEGTCGEGAPAIAAKLYFPIGVAGTSTGTYYIGNSFNQVVDSFTVGSNLQLLAGNNTNNNDLLVNKTPASGVQLGRPGGIFIDSAKNVYIAETGNSMVRELVNSTGLVNFFAGTGTEGYSGGGVAATAAELNDPFGVAKDSAGNVYVADTFNCLVRKVSPSGIITTFAGTVTSGVPHCGYGGDGQSAKGALLSDPYAVAIDSQNNVYIADASNELIRKVSGGTITTVAGTAGVAGFAGDGGPATSSQLYYPRAVALDPQGNLFIADNYNCRVRRVDAVSGFITTVAGDGVCNTLGDGIATETALDFPQGLAVDENDNLFISENKDRIRWVSPNGIMTTIAGTAEDGYNGDGGPATLALLSNPTGVALDAAGNIFFADTNNSRVRKIAAFPAISTNTPSLAFGLTPVGSNSVSQTVVVSALGAATISSIDTSGDFKETNDCPLSFSNGATCTMTVTFAPTGSGTANGAITIHNNGHFSKATTLALAGQGTAITITPASLNFGSQLVKTSSAAKTVVLKNNGDTSVTMGVITLSDTTNYKETNNCPPSGSALASAGSCTISVAFDPQTTGTKAAKVPVADSDPSSPQVLSLTGIAINAVSLSPSSITFPDTAVGSTSPASTIVLTNNTGGDLTLGTPAVSASGSFAKTSATTCTPALIVAEGQTCVIYVVFKPRQAGLSSGTVKVSDDSGTGTQSVPVQGTGTE
jgi:sugar lactone lactonase YvrE